MDQQTETLIRAAAIVKGPLLQRRMGLREAIAKAALANQKPGEPVKLPSLQKEIATKAGLTFDETTLISILDELAKQGLVRYRGENEFELVKAASVPGFAELTQEIWTEFTGFASKQDVAFDPYVDLVLRRAFDTVVLQLLVRFALSFDALRLQFEELPMEDFESNARAEANSIGVRDPNRFARVLTAYITSKSPKLLDFFYTMYDGFVNFDLLKREQELPVLDLETQVKYLIIDTNILVGLLCETDPIHPLCAAVATRSRETGVSLFYLPETRKEMWRLIDGSRWEMSGLVDRGSTPVVRSQLVQDYVRRSGSWTDYLAEVQNWELFLSLSYKIGLFPEDIEADPDVHEFVIRTLPLLDRIRIEERVRKGAGLVPRERDPHRLEHDASCLSVIARARSEAGKGAFGPLFLTFDNLLATLGEIRRQAAAGEIGLVIQPRAWMNYLLAYSKVEMPKEELAKVAEALLTLTVRVGGASLKLQEYANLVTFKIGLEEADVGIIRELFLASPLRAQMERALAQNRGDEADRVARQMLLSPDVLDRIVTERRTREKLQRVSEELVKTRETLAEERAKRVALERALDKPIRIETTVDTKIEIEVEAGVNGLLAQLLAVLPDGLKAAGLPDPPESPTTLERVKDWLGRLREAIETSETVTDTIRALLPLVTFLLGRVSGQ